MTEINKTVITTYKDAMVMMDYINNYCPCHRTEQFEKWYKSRNAFFVESGIFVMEDLLIDDVTNKPLRYCVAFDFSNKGLSKFTVINYYTQERVCDFSYEANDFHNVQSPKIVMEHYDKQKWFGLGGVFMNPQIAAKVKNMWNELDKVSRGKKRTVYSRMEKEARNKVEHAIREFMCSHTVAFVYSAMFYFAQEKPLEIENPFTEQAASSDSSESESVKKTKKYYYSGYIDLTKTKVYRANITERMEKEKRNYTRHIGKWSVRGHHRNVNGEKIWIDEHVKGHGELESRVYGTIPEKEVDLMPKVFEVEVAVKPKSQEELGPVAQEQIESQAAPAQETAPVEEPQVEIVESQESIAPPLPPIIIKFSFVDYFKRLFARAIKIIKTRK